MFPYQVLVGTYMPDVACYNRLASYHLDAAVYLGYKGTVHLDGTGIEGLDYSSG